MSRDENDLGPQDEDDLAPSKGILFGIVVGLTIFAIAWFIATL